VATGRLLACSFPPACAAARDFGQDRRITTMRGMAAGRAAATEELMEAQLRRWHAAVRDGKRAASVPNRHAAAGALRQQAGS